MKSNKNDFIDAEAIAEAVTRDNMRFVLIKTDDQLDLQALHRVRDRLVHPAHGPDQPYPRLPAGARRAYAKGRANLRNHMPAILEEAAQTLTPRLRTLLDHLRQEWKQLEADIEGISEQIELICGEDAACKRLQQIPGVRPLVATATVAAIGKGAAFRKGREFAAWLGLVPRQHSTGGKRSATLQCLGASRGTPSPMNVGTTLRHFLKRRHKVQSRGAEYYGKRVFGELKVIRLGPPPRTACACDEHHRKAGCSKWARPV